MPVDTHFRDVIVHLTYSRLHKTNILQDLQLLTLVGRTKEVLVPHLQAVINLNNLLFFLNT